MEQSIQSQIINRIKRGGHGKLIFPANFNDIGSNDAIRKALSRLVSSGIIKRLAQGIYLYPKHDPVLGVLYPSSEEIAESIAKRDKARIIPTGVTALHKLRLSTQVPMKVTYLTDGAPRKIKVGKQIITFKSTTARKLAMKGKISSLVIQALQELGKDAINKQIIDRISTALQKEDRKVIKEDAKLAPAWISDILITITENLEKNDRVASIK